MTENIKEAYIDRAVDYYGHGKGIEEHLERIESTYTEDAILNGVGSTDGFEYDVLLGGYIKPSKILKDKEKAKELQEAIDLLSDWRIELEMDVILNEY